MNQAAARVPLSDDVAGSAGALASMLARIESESLDHAGEKARRDSNKLLRRALAAWGRGETAKAAKCALAATEADDGNAPAFSLLGITLEKLGHLHKALVSFERAFQLQPDDPDLLFNLGLTAWNTANLAGAEAMFRHYIEARPGRPEGYNNLARVIRDRGDTERAIETVRLAIYRMPNESVLWNALGTLLSEAGRAEESLVFLQEALRLNPAFARGWHNLGYSYMHLGRLKESRDAFDRALALVANYHERLESRYARGICLMGLGELEEGFREYESRHAHEFRTYTLHYLRAPQWRGEPLAGKRILIAGEQGLGDEFMFANTIADFIRATGPEGKVQIAVDRRAVGLFARSFPEAETGPYERAKKDGIDIRLYPFALKDGDPDYYVPMASALLYLRKSVADFPRNAYLKADPERTRHFRAELESLGTGFYAGICWRSMMLSNQRSKYYSAIEAWKPVFDVPGVRFVNLQYGKVAEEIAAAESALGVKIHSFAGLDLKDDLDGAAAATEACDLVISAPTAVAALSGAIGKETWFITAGRAWPQLGTDHYPWYRSSRVFACERFADWQKLMPRLADSLAQFANSR